MSAPNSVPFSLPFSVLKSTFSEAYLDVWCRVPFGNLEQVVDRVEGLLGNPDLLLDGPTANCASFSHRVAGLVSTRYPAMKPEMNYLCTPSHGAIGWHDKTSKVVFLIDSSARKMILLGNKDIERVTLTNKVIEWRREDEGGKIQIFTKTTTNGVQVPWVLFEKQESLIEFVHVAFTVGNKPNGLPREAVLLPRLLRDGVASFEGIFRFSLDSTPTGNGTLVLKLGRNDLSARIEASTQDGVCREVALFLQTCRGRYSKRPGQWAQVKAAERKLAQAIFILKSTAET